MITASGELSFVWWLLILEQNGRYHSIVNVITFSFTRQPEQYFTVTTSSLWSVCSFFTFNPISFVFFSSFICYTCNYHRCKISSSSSVSSLCSSSSLLVASTFFVLPSSVSLLFLYGTIEAKLRNELGFLRASISQLVVICLCGEKQINTWTRFRNVFLHSTGGPPRKCQQLIFVHSAMTPSECHATIPYVIPWYCCKATILIFYQIFASFLFDHL